MTLQPVAPLWALLPVTMVALAACVVAARRTGRRGAWARRMLAVALLAGVAARPAGADTEAAAVSTDLDVYVLVDRTASIVAEDYDGTRPRLEGVKEDLIALADGLTGARFALIGYDNNVVDLMPLTNDLDAFAVTVDILHPEMTTYSTGSSPRLPVEQMRARLAAAADQDPDRRRVLLLVTDGEATIDPAPTDSFAPLADLIDGGAVLGYGTSAGGPMREWTGLAGAVGAPPVQDPATGAAAVSRIDEATLRAIADELEVAYVHRERPGGIEQVIAELGTGRGETTTGSRLTVTQDRSWLLAWPLLALALIEIAVVVAELARTTTTRRPPPTRAVSP
jgi:Ca-activated chloride channel family protein